MSVFIYVPTLNNRNMGILTSSGSIKQGQPVLMDAWESMANAPQKTRRRSINEHFVNDRKTQSKKRHVAIRENTELEVR